MQLQHLLSSGNIRSVTDGDRAFFLRSGSGAFLYTFTTRQTRYEGWFIASSLPSAAAQPFYKLIERIEILADDGSVLPVTGITVSDTDAAWELADGTHASWQLNRDSLDIALNAPRRLRLILDTRGMYRSPVEDRQYTVRSQPGITAVQYHDPSLDAPLYLHLRHTVLGGVPDAVFPDRWEAYPYPRDTSRHSEPATLYGYIAAELTTNRLSIGAGWSAVAARDESRAAATRPHVISHSGPTHTPVTLATAVTAARHTTRRGLQWLESPTGLWAGLPWFHQVWSRDELIAALGLEPEERAKIIERYLTVPLENGELPTFFGSGTTCADGLGWLNLLVREQGVRTLNAAQRRQYLLLLQVAHLQLRRSRLARHGLVSSGHNSTWMDTVGRSGFPLEIQCMYGLLLEMLFTLTNSRAYESERIRFLGLIRQRYLKNGVLSDNLDDPTIRPNVFLAYLLQPDLLTSNAWQRCFDRVLAVTRCSWGGLTSLNPADPRYRPFSTGEDNQSYHNGDSWFFVNNLAALALHRLNPKHNAKEVIALLHGSTQETLWEHALGMPGEISSAAALDSWGCGLQAFSGGTYLALTRELEQDQGQDREAIEAFWDATALSASPSFLR